MFFQGRELWHCSVSVWDRSTGRPKLLKNWTAGEQGVTQSFALNTLDGAGLIGDDRLQTGDIAMHRRRALTDEEISRLPRTRATGPMVSA